MEGLCARRPVAGTRIPRLCRAGARVRFRTAGRARCGGAAVAARTLDRRRRGARLAGGGTAHRAACLARLALFGLRGDRR
jgi:hypothetical protein